MCIRDRVEIFQRGKYERMIDAGVEDGDFNGDGRFDSGDLVLAFQAGSYVRDAKVAAAIFNDDGFVNSLEDEGLL